MIRLKASNPSYLIQVSSKLVKFSASAVMKKENGNYRLNLVVNDYPLSVIVLDPRKALGLQVITKSGHSTGIVLSYERPEKSLQVSILSRSVRLLAKLEGSETLVISLEHSADGNQFNTDITLKYNLKNELSTIRLEWDEKMLKSLIDSAKTTTKNLLVKYTPLTAEKKDQIMKY